MSDELPPEVQAVLDAAVDYIYGSAAGSADRFQDAVAAYRKSITPEPFEAWVVFHSGGNGATYYSHDPYVTGVPVWRCTVTPVERVR